jgi:hypothetical protein
LEVTTELVHANRPKVSSFLEHNRCNLFLISLFSLHQKDSNRNADSSNTPTLPHEIVRSLILL